MSLEAFAKVFPIPHHPLEAGESAQWPTFEQQLSTELPDDYKRFIEWYGSGCVSMFLWIFNPFSSNKNLNLIEQAKFYAKQFKKLGEQSKIFPIFPEPGGLLPFGVSDNGDVFYWLTSPHGPRQWKVAINKTRSDHYELFEMSMTGFLLGIVEEKIESQIFAKEMIQSDKLFLPANQVVY